MRIGRAAHAAASTRRWSPAPSWSLPIALLAAGELGLGPLLGLLAAPLAVGPLGRVMTRTDGPALNGALAGTGALLGAFSRCSPLRPADRRD